MSTSKQLEMISYALEGKLEKVKALLNNHASVKVDWRDEDGHTALVLACMNGRDRVATYLLDKGANIEAKEPFGRSTPLVVACQSGHYSTVKLLLARGANIASIADTSCLHDASESGRHQILKLLLDHGADVHKTSIFYGTPLHCACGFGKKKCVEVLLRHGADPRMIHEGNTPLDLAQEYGHKAIIALLMKCSQTSTRHVGVRDVHNPMDRDSSSSSEHVSHMKQEHQVPVLVEEESDSELIRMVEKLTLRMEAMERKSEKQLSELRKQHEEKVMHLEKELKDISAVNETLTSQLQEVEERIDQSNDDMHNIEEELSEAHKAFQTLTEKLAESNEKVSNLEYQLTEESEELTSHLQDLEEKVHQTNGKVLSMEKEVKDGFTSAAEECANSVSTKFDNEVSDAQKSIAVEAKRMKEQLTSDLSSIDSALNEKFSSHLKCVNEMSEKKEKEMIKIISTLRHEVSQTNEKVQQLETELREKEKEEGKEMSKVLLEALYDHLEVFAESGTVEEKMFGEDEEASHATNSHYH